MFDVPVLANKAQLPLQMPCFDSNCSRVKPSASCTEVIAICGCGLCPGVTWLHRDCCRQQPSRVTPADRVTLRARDEGLLACVLLHGTTQYLMDGNAGEILPAVHAGHCAVVAKRKVVCGHGRKAWGPGPLLYAAIQQLRRDS